MKWLLIIAGLTVAGVLVSLDRQVEPLSIDIGPVTKSQNAEIKNARPPMVGAVMTHTTGFVTPLLSPDCPYHDSVRLHCVDVLHTQP